MKKLGIGLVMAMALVAVTGAAAFVADVTRADDEGAAQRQRPAARQSIDGESHRDGRSQLRGNARGPQSGPDAKKMPFIGIAIGALGEDAAAELGVDGGVVVRHVAEDSPADGLLMADDVITEIEGEDVSTPADVVRMVREAEAGDTLSLTVLRDGDTVDVDIVVGERETAQARHFGPLRGMHGPNLGGILGGIRGLVDAEVTVETEDGLKTINAITGTVAEVDVDAGTFVLDPTDGSDSVEFAIDDETAVMIRHNGDLSGLNNEDKTLVVTVTADGETKVKLVRQGEAVGKGRGHFRIFGRGPGLSLEMLPEELRERLGERLGEGGLGARLRGLIPGTGESFEFEQFLDGEPQALDRLPESFGGVSQ